ncbi:MAG TPA: helix-turn-helix domain-containing protein [Bellilinea sp.]|nr:helix-turn-helix domain-containing protein [Bellilinea sp.]
MSHQTYNSFQAAELLGLSVRRVQALINVDLLKADKVGRDWIISEEELQKFKHQVRSVGRPTKERTEEDSSYIEQPTHLYLQVVEFIRTLIDLEGLGAAYRAFAEAAWRRIQAETMTGYKPKGLSHVCIHRLLGKKRCPDPSEHPCETSIIPGRDHLSEWVKEGKTAKIVMQPYHMSFETMKELVEFCENRGLRADISAESWHFSGKTLRIDITLKS